MFCAYNMLPNFRTCEICQRTFKSEKGLLQHAGRDGKASSCHRYQHVKTKASKIKKIRTRRKKAKKTPVSKVDLTGWNRAIAPGTHYTKNAKQILNLIFYYWYNIRV